MAAGKNGSSRSRQHSQEVEKHTHTQNHLLLRFMYMQIQERIHKSSFRITRNTDVAEFSTFQPKNDDLYKWHAQLSPAW